MELKRAKEVLEEMGLTTFSKEELFSGALYLSVEADDETAIIDGRFTADQLEAIATWMRDPEGVVGA